MNLPGLGMLKLRRTEVLAGRLRSVTLRCEAGAWHASITAAGVPAPVVPAPVRNALGVDIGLKDLVVRSDGRRVPAPTALKSSLARLRRCQRHYVRQRDAAARRQGLDPAAPFQKGTRIEASNRMCRTRQRVATLHARIGAVRREALHRATTAIVRSAQVIAIEDLAVKAMARGMGRRGFRRTCSVCGAVNKALQLHQRRWTCPACDTEHDRDDNAAINIEREGLRLIASASNTPMSGGINARGDLGAVAEARRPLGPSPFPGQVIALPQSRTGIRPCGSSHRRSLNRELVARRCAPNHSKRADGTRGEGGA